MQLEQPPPDLPVIQATPFDHLRPSLWRASKVAHITLVSLGTIMLLPAGLVMLGLVQFFLVWGSVSGLGSGLDTLAVLGIISSVVGSSLGILAWSALSLLFFKRNDARWQRICWAICGVFGVVTAPCLLGWLVWLFSEGLGGGGGSGEEWIVLIFFSMLGVTLAAAILGFRYSIAAGGALKQSPSEEDRSAIG